MPARLIALAILLGLGGYLYRSGIVVLPATQDNDWPLLMWLATHASSDPSTLAIGHYGPLQLILVDRLWPWFGSTLLAAKWLNLVATLTSGWLVFLLASRLAGSVAGIGALALFSVTAETLLTGQSEFGDPLALACWLGGLVLALGARRWPWLIVAGIALGIAGGFRLHFQAFALITIVLVIATSWRRPSVASGQYLGAGALILGWAMGYAPTALTFYQAHRTLSSPIASTFVGQVLFGFDEYDMLATYARHPFAEVVREHLPELARLVLERIMDLPRRHYLSLAAALLLLLPPARGRRTLLLLGLAVAYYLAFVAVAWNLTFRLLLPFATVLAVAAMVGITQVLPRRWAVWAITALVATRAISDVPRVRRELAQVETTWRRSTELTAVLRAHGLHAPRQAFVVDWNRCLVDDPTLITFYNFGFWNLLHPGFRGERPNPIATVDDPLALSTFLRNQNVDFAVLPRAHARFLVLTAVAKGERDLPGFHRIAELPDDVVFERDP